MKRSHLTGCRGTLGPVAIYGCFTGSTRVFLKDSQFAFILALGAFDGRAGTFEFAFYVFHAKSCSFGRFLSILHIQRKYFSCFGIADIEPQAVLLGLDRAGIAAHSGSACASESLEPSPVLEAMGLDAHRSLRFSVGWSSTDADIDAAIAALPVVLSDLRRLR